MLAIYSATIAVYNAAVHQAVLQYLLYKILYTRIHQTVLPYNSQLYNNNYIL